MNDFDFELKKNKITICTKRTTIKKFITTYYNYSNRFAVAHYDTNTYGIHATERIKEDLQFRKLALLALSKYTELGGNIQDLPKIYQLKNLNYNVAIKCTILEAAELMGIKNV